jgi:hypothetical protein
MEGVQSRIGHFSGWNDPDIWRTGQKNGGLDRKTRQNDNLLSSCPCFLAELAMKWLCLQAFRTVIGSGKEAKKKKTCQALFFTPGSVMGYYPLT